ncbi:MAG TPA: hypothetical protein VIF64_00670, partial [Pyrinomonadaceae bacterium]
RCARRILMFTPTIQYLLRAFCRPFKVAVEREIERLWYLEFCFGLKRRSVFTVVVAAVAVGGALPWDRSCVGHRFVAV